MIHCGTSDIDNQYDHRLIVLKVIQHDTSIRMRCAGSIVVDVSWNNFGVLGLEWCCACLAL